MPEGIEVELYRRAAAATIGRTIASAQLSDSSYLRGGLNGAALEQLITGCTVEAVRRHGKLLLLDLDAATLGLRFGMTGRLIVDGHATIHRLEYSSARDDPAWDRFTLSFHNGSRLVIRDQRKLGSVELDPDESALGVDLFDIDGVALRQILEGSNAALKSRLMDQSQIAGLGNLLTDEILWRAALDPRSTASAVGALDRRRLLYHLKAVPSRLLTRGGSHLGDLQDQRNPDGRCPRDGTGLRRHTVGGRTTYACPEHQRLL